MTITLWHVLAVAAALFGIGLVGFLTRRNLITMFLCAEMMLQGVAINFVAFARYHGNLQGQVFVLFILAVAACEAGIALALFLNLYRRRRSLDASDWQELRELGVPPAVDVVPLPAVEEEPEPRLPPAGARPAPPATETATEAARV
jgi:NADH-quinone oxidoreductase subunit K